MKEEKKLTYSKLIVLITAIIFIVCLLLSFYAFLTSTVDNVIDTTVLVTAITVSGGIFGSNLCWYSKKAAGENNYKLRMALYKDSTETRLKYNEEMMKLMKEYDISEEDIEKINDSTDIDDMMDNALNDTVSNLDENRDDCSSLNEMQNFN
jgi:hypothetical protein